MGLTYSLLYDDTQVSQFIFDHDGNPATPDIEQCNPLNPSRPLLCAQEGEFLTSVAGFSFNWDRRNDPVEPTRGFSLQLSQDFAGLGGDVHYLRTELDGGVYRGLLPGVTASFRLSAGYIAGWDDDEVRINDRFFKGGSSFRGFDVAGIGPRQIQVSTNAAGEHINNSPVFGDALGGNAYYIGTAQLSLPLFLPEQFGLSAALFAEAGSLGILDDGSKGTFISPNSSGGTNTLYVEDSLSLRASAGISIFWDSPFGPVQFDFAEPFLHDYYDRTETFRFSTRTRF
jgi:outer membrane protein insertion porin family